jgi:uncharacterized membrane protein (DUF373 family)
VSVYSKSFKPKALVVINRKIIANYENTPKTALNVLNLLALLGAISLYQLEVMPELSQKSKHEAA